MSTIVRGKEGAAGATVGAAKGVGPDRLQTDVDRPGTVLRIVAVALYFEGSMCAM